MLHLEAVSQVDEQEKVFISSVFTVPKMERGIEYGKRFILNLKVSGFCTAPEQRYDRIASDPILLVFLILCRKILVYLITQGFTTNIITELE